MTEYIIATMDEAADNDPSVELWEKHPGTRLMLSDRTCGYGKLWVAEGDEYPYATMCAADFEKRTGIVLSSGEKVVIKADMVGYVPTAY